MYRALQILREERNNLQRQLSGAAASKRAKARLAKTKKG